MRSIQRTHYDGIIALLVRQEEKAAYEEIVTAIDGTEMASDIRDVLEEEFPSVFGKKKQEQFFLDEHTLLQWQAMKHDPEIVRLFGKK